MLQNYDIKKTAESLFGVPIISIQAATGGRNSRVFKVKTKTDTYALKIYPAPTSGNILFDRMDQEVTGLNFMRNNGISCVPLNIFIDQNSRCAAYEWINGNIPTKIIKADVDAMLSITFSLASLSILPTAKKLNSASDSCFSGADVINQLNRRLTRLISSNQPPVISKFLKNDLLPTFKLLEMRAKHIYKSSMLDFEKPLDQLQRTLSPSDFGFHNSVRRPDRSIIFVDFEYFGWDDPVKMISDAFWHPGPSWGSNSAEYFRNESISFFNARYGKTFEIRYDALSPLFGLIWCLITLNEFIPERQEYRTANGLQAMTNEQKTNQITASKHILKQITNWHLGS